jgi:hypothetical protein
VYDHVGYYEVSVHGLAFGPVNQPRLLEITFLAHPKRIPKVRSLNA